MIIRCLLISILFIYNCGFSETNHTNQQSKRLLETDKKAYKTFTQSMNALSAANLPKDNSGLIGRNHKWGKMYSPRFQLGAGKALRMTIAAQRPREALLAFRAIQVPTNTIKANGFVPSKLPKHIGGNPSASDIASGAAFFLGEACLAIQALEAQGKSQLVVNNQQLNKVKTKLANAVGWLLSQKELLAKIDQKAPNRLLFNALAFQACHAFSSDKEIVIQSKKTAESFVNQALKLFHKDGYFIEYAGHDTSYQGVAIHVGEDILLAAYDDSSNRLRKTLNKAASWLAARIDTQGRIDSTGNTRTCWSNEKVFNKPKLISISEIFTGLVYTGIQTNDPKLIQSAKRIQQWVKSKRGTNPCYKNLDIG